MSAGLGPFYLKFTAEVRGTFATTFAQLSKNLRYPRICGALSPSRDVRGPGHFRREGGAPGRVGANPSHNREEPTKKRLRIRPRGVSMQWCGRKELNLHEIALIRT